jgi:hypothetical protein
MRHALPLVLAVALTVAATGCGGSNNSGAQAPSSAPKRTLTDLQNVDQLKRAFNTASDEPRLVVIVSPT